MGVYMKQHIALFCAAQGETVAIIEIVCDHQPDEKATRPAQARQP